MASANDDVARFFRDDSLLVCARHVRDNIQLLWARCAMAVGSYTEEQFGSRLKLFIRPAKPVDELGMLHGREKQLETIRRALFADGRSVFIFGDRGVGKSSLAKIAASQYRDNNKDFLYVQCEDSSTLPSVLLALARKAGVAETGEQERKHGFSAGWGDILRYTHERTTKIGEDKLVEPPSLDACVELVSDIVNRVGEKTIAVVDEFDAIRDIRERQRFGDLLKRIGDRDVDFKLILSGIGPSLHDLLGGHLSSIRQLETVELDRLSWDARWEIIEAAAAGVGVTINHDLCVRIAAISNGFPHYVHLLTEKLLWRMFSDPDSMTDATPEHYRGALDDAVESVAPHLKGPYLAATQRVSEDYRDAVWAAADAYDLQRHTARVFESYVRICEQLGKEPLERKKLLARLNDLKGEKYGAILQGMQNRTGWYEFRENMVRGFVRLVAEQNGVELYDRAADAPRQLTARVPNIRPRQAYRLPNEPRVRFRGESRDEDDDT